MEVIDGVVLKSSPCCYTHIGKPSLTSKNSSFLSSQIKFRRENRIPSFRKSVLKVGNYGFEEKNHLDYYSMVSSPVVCGEKKGKKGVSTKKKMKLLKGLVKDLSTFSELGLDCDDTNQDFVADDKSKIISQAAEILLAQLKQLREEEQMKKEKEEMGKCKSQDCESSSSSSESSDSECNEVIDMKCVKNKAIVQPIEIKKIQLANEEPSVTPPITLLDEQLSQNLEQKCSNMILEMTLNKDSGIEVLNSETLNLNQSKIEVCMGGKCKKLGAPALMEEFQRVVGDEGVVVGCKCMGKCKSAPNVKVLNNNVGDDSLRTPSNALYVGVGLEDVGLIVANYLGEEWNGDQLSFAASGVLC